MLGPESLAALKLAAGPEAAAKLDRAPTLVVASQVRSEDGVQDEEDLCAVAAAISYVLLAAHARGLAGYWRTPAVLRSDGGAGRRRRAGGRARAGPDPPGPAAPGQGAARAPPARRLRNVPAVIPRADALASLERDSFDLVVVGGGITGAGVALDAASRGYSVALLERSDFAAGTSSRSSKLIHGGLRYLQNFDLGLVREALLERSLLVKLAPHLVKPLPLLVPSFEGKRPDRLTGVGLNMYDVMAWRRGREEGEEWSPARHRIIEGAEAVELAPALAGREPTAAYLFYDCQTDDVRMVLSVLGEAERFGAVIANRCEATGLVEKDGRAIGVLARDTETGTEFEVTGDQRDQRHRGVGRPAAPRRALPPRGDAAHPAEPRHARDAVARAAEGGGRA